MAISGLSSSGSRLEFDSHYVLITDVALRIERYGKTAGFIIWRNCSRSRFLQVVLYLHNKRNYKITDLAVKLFLYETLQK